MTERIEQNAELSPLKRAYLALQESQARVEQLERAESEPIAVIGLGCRFPGADGPDAFWDLLRGGVEAIREVPSDRWDIDRFYDPDPDAPGKMATRRGGFIDRADLFDPQFFNIAPREAIDMDPQQRLLLETAWEALEHAAQSPERLHRTRTGVFVGICGNDYAHLYARRADPRLFDTWFASGVAHSIASGRISYILGLQGPSLSVDTACSSSLVAVHLAVRSLRAGECRLALAGGVNLMLAPETTISLSRTHMLAPDGRCKAFDAAADGFVRGEGCGVVVLKKLSDARADGDRILAAIRGTAINQDGPGSGLTVPNGPAQQAVMRDALNNAGADPAQIDYVETHGTGTPLGDPIEVQAIGEVFRDAKTPGAPLAIGSVKTNIGHLEAAAGAAGLIKVVLALERGQIPPHLHLKRLNPHIAWEEYPVEVATELRAWPSDEPRMAGVSSFGFSGTNAHVILESAPACEPTKAAVERPMHLLPISARDETALRELIARHHGFLKAHPDISLPDAAHTLGAARSHFEWRSVVLAENRDEAIAKLDEPDDRGFRLASSDPPKIAFLFPGQGAQYAGMARELYDAHPAFRRTLDRCDELLRPALDPSLLSVIFDEALAAQYLDRTAWTQPALFAVEVALAELWRAWGVEPSVVMGHSVGEIAAACAAGMLSVEDGLQWIAERGRLMQSLPAGGAMAAVFADEASVARAIADREEAVSIAAFNGPENVVISGEAQAVEEILQRLESDGIAAKKLSVSHAFHSPLMEPILDAFAARTALLTFAEPRVPIVSNRTGRAAGAGEMATPDYWREHARLPVRFHDSMRALATMRCGVFLEIGPQPTLLGMGRRCIDSSDALWLPSLRRGRSGWGQMLESLAELYLRGASIDWAGFDREYPRRKFSMPTYPFQRTRYWFEDRLEERTGDAQTETPGEASGLHPLLGRRLLSGSPDVVFETKMHPRRPAWLGDHRLFGAAVVPGMAWVEMVLAGARSVFDEGGSEIEELAIPEALILDDANPVCVQLIFHPEDGAAAFEIYSLIEGDGAGGRWKLHASGKVRSIAEGEKPLPRRENWEDAQKRCAETVDAASFYQRLRECGLEFGETFRGVSKILIGRNEAWGEIVTPETLADAADDDDFHPALLDACVQVVAAAARSGDDALSDVFVPVALEGVRVFSPPRSRLWSHASIGCAASPTPDTLSGSVNVYDEAGNAVAVFSKIRFKRVSRRELLRAARRNIDDWFYGVQWAPRPLADAPEGIQFPSPETLSQSASLGAEKTAREAGLDRYAAMLPSLDRLCAAYLSNALLALGWHYKPGDFFDLTDLMKSLGADARYERLLRRYLDIICEEGVVEAEDGRWRAVRELQSCDTEGLYEKLRETWPESRAQLAVTDRCGRRLSEILRGESDPLSALFPEGSFDDAFALYAESPGARAFNALAAEAVAQCLESAPNERPLRILEIGAGTGGTTQAMLGRLSAGEFHYTFSDVSPRFVSEAKRRFAAYPDVEFRTLDIEADPVAQGFDERGYDLIVAANVLHATADLKRTLERVRRLLRPGGLLFMIEVTGPDRWVDVTFGLTDGWWKFTDADLRVGSPVMPPERWREVLARAGFDSSSAAPSSASSEIGLNLQAIILARNSTEAAAGEDDNASEPWRIFSDDAAAGKVLSDELCAGGVCARFAEETDGDECGAIYFVSAPDGNERDFSASDLRDYQQRTCGGLLRLIQSSLRCAKPPRLFVVTRGAQAVGEDEGESNPASATLWGLRRTLALEHPELRSTIIDLPAGVSAKEAAHIVRNEIARGDGEPEVAWRHGRRFVPRLIPLSFPEKPLHRDGECQPVKWEIAQAGTFDGLRRAELHRRTSGPGEVEIRVLAAGLNFKDALKVLDMYPGDDGPLGGECAGVVESVGSGVEGLQAGDPVLAVAAGSFASFATTRAELVFRKPEGMSFEQAATFPIAWLTAHHALVRLGKLREGESVLIHSAAGGVGLAAVHLAQSIGARVFATAGHPKKRDFLKSIGVEHVFDSRSLEFAERIRAVTDGRGIDVVLNSLADEFIATSLSTLAEGGRFLEIGRRGIWTPEQMAQVRPDVVYIPIDLTAELENSPGRLRPDIEALLGRAASGALPLHPVRAFSFERAAEALRYMALGRHIGKIAVSLENYDAIRSDAAYLITGGFGALGLRVAQWLAERGARHLVLLGRSVPSSPAEAVMTALREKEVRIETVQADVADARAMEELFAQFGESLPPLRGVVHAAGALDPAALMQQDWPRFARVFAPKVEGAWNLHRLTRDLPLDFFVLFSSVASVFGAPGQANHAAANAFMDALAAYRRRHGLPAVSVDWGVWEEIGAGARHGVGANAGDLGMGSFLPDEGLRALERMLGAPPQVVFAPVDWNKFLSPLGRDDPRRRFFEKAAKDVQVKHEARREPAKKRTAPDLLERLASAQPNRRRDALAEYLRSAARHALGFDATTEIDERKPLNELGLDSLMAVELRNAIGGALGRSLPATLLFDYPTLRALTDYLASEVLELEGERKAEMPDGKKEDVVGQIENLSDEDVDRLLAKKASGKR